MSNLERKTLYYNDLRLTIAQRLAGSSTVNTRTAFETIMEILNMLILFDPMRVFMSASLICILGGLIWGLPIVVRGRGVSTGAMLAVLTGFIFFSLGLIAEQLSMLRKSRTGSQRKGL